MTFADIAREAGSMDETLRLAFLGGFSAARGEAPIRGFVSRKTEALLCYLAVTRRPHRRAALATLLWGDLPDERANLSLRQSLHNLRQLLPDHLHVTRGEVAFRRDSPYWLDVEAFEAALGGAALAAPGTPLRALAAAADLCRGAGRGAGGGGLRVAPRGEPARAADAADRPRARDCRRPRAAAAPGRPARHPAGDRRRRQDAPGAGGGARPRAGVRRRRGLRHP